MYHKNMIYDHGRIGYNLELSISVKKAMNLLERETNL